MMSLSPLEPSQYVASAIGYRLNSPASGRSGRSGVLGRPSLNVQGTVLALRMLVVVQVENVSVEELALFRRCTISRRVVDSVLSLSITGCGTKSSIKGARKDLAGNEGVEALSIKRGINSTGTIVYGIRVASRGGQGVVSVAVGSSDQDLKLIAVLSALSQDI